MFFGLQQRYCETLWTGTWFGQFSELVMKLAVRNIERARGQTAERWRLNKAQKLHAANRIRLFQTFGTEVAAR